MRNQQYTTCRLALCSVRLLLHVLSFRETKITIIILSCPEDLMTRSRVHTQQWTFLVSMTPKTGVIVVSRTLQTGKLSFLWWVKFFWEESLCRSSREISAQKIEVQTSGFLCLPRGRFRIFRNRKRPFNLFADYLHHPLTNKKFTCHRENSFSISGSCDRTISPPIVWIIETWDIHCGVRICEWIVHFSRQHEKTFIALDLRRRRTWSSERAKQRADW